MGDRLIRMSFLLATAALASSAHDITIAARAIMIHRPRMIVTGALGKALPGRTLDAQWRLCNRDG